MNSRPLLDYLVHPDELSELPPTAAELNERRVDPIEMRLKDLEARLRVNATLATPPKQDLTLSAQIEAILKRKADLQPQRARVTSHDAVEAREPVRTPRVVLDPPPPFAAANDMPSADHDFVKFSEAVYLIGQAAKRFIEQPQAHPIVPQPAGVPAPSAGELDALSAVLRETVSAFRSVADDLAVSAGEIRHYATREDRGPSRSRPRPARHRDDEIMELREHIDDLQEQLDELLHARRRGRY